MRVNRRQFLLGAGATAAFPALRHVGSAHAGELTPLRDRAAAKGFFYGAAPSAEQLQENPLFAEAIARECNVLVSAGELHMKNLRPTPTEFDFAGGDFLADFAAAHDMGYRGHALIWHWAFPEWANDTQPGDPAEVLMVDHIKTLAGRYAGRMHSWDVVNEAINPWNGREDCLRETEWFELIGPEYVDLAFHTAAEIPP